VRDSRASHRPSFAEVRQEPENDLRFEREMNAGGSAVRDGRGSSPPKGGTLAGPARNAIRTTVDGDFSRGKRSFQNHQLRARKRMMQLASVRNA
jgi:hypothetical protein